LAREKLSQSELPGLALDTHAMMPNSSLTASGMQQISDRMQQSLHLCNELLFDVDYRILKPVVDSILREYLHRHSRRIDSFSPDLLRHAYLLWSRMYLELVASGDLHAHILPIELPIVYRNSKPSERIDAFKVESINGHSPDPDELMTLRRLADQKYLSFGHATYAMSHCFGTDMTFIIHEYKVNHQYSFEQQGYRRINSHTKQLERYIVYANIVDARINELQCSEGRWPDSPRVTAGVLHYCGIPTLPSETAIEFHCSSSL
jgi:hypothetical protein